MPYVIEYDGLRFPVHDFDVNRTPPFSFFWGVRSKDLVGIIHDPIKDYFQITFSTYNIESLARKVIANFTSGSQSSITTPYASFSDAIIHQATIDDEKIEVSLLANTPSSGQTNLSHDLCLALEVNYRNSIPNFVNLFQFGNYLAISTFPFQLNRHIDGGTVYFENAHWTVFEMPVSRRPQIYKYKLEQITGYCFTNLPEIMSNLVIQPSHKNNYVYAFGVNPTCELSAYIQITDLIGGETWFMSGNHGTLELAPGTYEITPIVVIPEFNPKFIYGPGTTLIVPESQRVLMFLSPLTISLNEPLKLFTYEDIILHFEGWKTVKVHANTLAEIYFDFPGTFRCNVYSLNRNAYITSFTIQVYSTSIPEHELDCLIKVKENLITKNSKVSTDMPSYLALSDIGKMLGCNRTTHITVHNGLLTDRSQVLLDNIDSDYYTVSTDTGKILDSSTPDDFIKSVDVLFHSIPVVNKPVYVSIDGLVRDIEIEDAIIECISNTTYRVTFRSEGLKKITLYLPNDQVLEKYVSVEPGFRRIVQITEDGHAKCITGDYWAIIQSPSITCTVPPNSVYEWTEYGFGPTTIQVTLVKGSVISEVQYQYMVYNKDALTIVAYDRILQLLALPHAEIDHVIWYLNDMFIGIGSSVTVPYHIPGGTYIAKAIVHSNFKRVVLTKEVNLSKNNINRLQLSNQPIHPYIDPESTNRLVTIYNGTPSVNFQYLHSSLNISLSKYLYLEKHTFVGRAKDLSW